jgi:hypothetical protein
MSAASTLARDDMPREERGTAMSLRRVTAGIVEAENPSRKRRGGKVPSTLEAASHRPVDTRTGDHRPKAS